MGGSEKASDVPAILLGDRRLQSLCPHEPHLPPQHMQAAEQLFL